MKLLLDENLPVKLKYRFRDQGFNAYTTRDMQWTGKENGELIRLMLLSAFTTLITIDNNLSFQQNFIKYPINVLVFVSNDNTYETIMEIFTISTEKLKTGFTGVQVVIHPAHPSYKDT